MCMQSQDNSYIHVWLCISVELEDWAKSACCFNKCKIKDIVNFEGSLVMKVYIIYDIFLFLITGKLALNVQKS